MRRRASATQGTLELSFHDSSAPGTTAELPLVTSEEPQAEAASGAPAPGTVRPRQRRRAVSRPIRGEQDVPMRSGPDDWRLDGATRKVGRSGVAQARAALAAIADESRRVDAA